MFSLFKIKHHESIQKPPCGVKLLTGSSLQPCLPISQVGKRSLSGGKHSVQCHTALWRQSWDSAASELLPSPQLLMRLGHLGGEEKSRPHKPKALRVLSIREAVWIEGQKKR